jgi:hypothetical protein
MTRRCTAGQRARIINGGWNAGKVVVVVRAYHGEALSGTTWPLVVFPWVVSSLSSALRSRCLDTGKEVAATMVIVCDDRDLQPLNDEDEKEQSNESNELQAPVNRSATSCATGCVSAI